MSALVGGPGDGLGGLAGLGWDPVWQAAFAPIGDGLVAARVVGAHRGTWEVALGGPEAPLEARATGRLRHEAGPEAVTGASDERAHRPTSPGTVAVNGFRKSVSRVRSSNPMAR